jgi:hypothetical protein
MGRLVAVCISATIRGDGVNEVISHPAPTSCIQVPMFEVSEAIHRARKVGWCNGRQVDGLTASERRPLVKYESAFSKAIARPFAFICDQRAQGPCHPRTFSDGSNKVMKIENVSDRTYSR